MARLPSLQEWAPSADPMQRLPSLQEWVRVNSLGRGRPDRMPSVAEWERLASVLGVAGGAESARRLLGERAPSLTFQPLQHADAGQQAAGGSEPLGRLLGDRAPSLTFQQPVQLVQAGSPLNPLRNGTGRATPAGCLDDATPFSSAAHIGEQVGRKRMATPEIVSAAETLMFRNAVRPRVQ